MPKNAIRNPRWKRKRRRRRPKPPVPPSPVPILLPYEDSWRAHYNDPSAVRCGAFAVCQMVSIHYKHALSPEPVYQRAVQLQPPGPWTSPWACLAAAKEYGLLSSFEWFKTLDIARATIDSGAAFIVLSKWPGTDGHIWCVRGYSDTERVLYTPFTSGLPTDLTCSYESFEQQMEWSGAICAVGLF